MTPTDFFLLISSFQQYTHHCGAQVGDGGEARWAEVAVWSPRRGVSMEGDHQYSAMEAGERTSSCVREEDIRFQMRADHSWATAAGPRCGTHNAVTSG